MSYIHTSYIPMAWKGSQFRDPTLVQFLAEYPNYSYAHPPSRESRNPGILVNPTGTRGSDLQSGRSLKGPRSSARKLTRALVLPPVVNHLRLWPRESEWVSEYNTYPTLGMYLLSHFDLRKMQKVEKASIQFAVEMHRVTDHRYQEKERKNTSPSVYWIKRVSWGEKREY